MQLVFTRLAANSWLRHCSCWGEEMRERHGMWRVIGAYSARDAACRWQIAHHRQLHHVLEKQNLAFSLLSVVKVIAIKQRISDGLLYY